MAIKFRAKIKNSREKIQALCPACDTWNDIKKKNALEGLVTFKCRGCQSVWTTEPNEIDIIFPNNE